MKTHLDIRCVDCGNPYPEKGLPYICQQCGGVYDFNTFPIFDSGRIDYKKPGLWKYQYSFGLTKDHSAISIGEGNTPLIWHPTENAAFKLESHNPTASYKDRGSSVLIAHLIERGIKYAVEDSSGNAGASYAAYCARVGIHGRVFIPDSASGAKRKQIEMFGAEVVPVPGPRANAAVRVMDAAQSGIPYASHAYQPFGMLGIATIAYEITLQTGGNVGTIISPAGHGNLFLGLIYGFQSLVEAKILDSMPMMIGVQSENCSPIASAYPDMVIDPNYLPKPTTAEGVSVSKPVRGTKILSMLKQIDGKIVSVSEDKIFPNRAKLATLGIFVEPTSALPWAVYQETKAILNPPVIMIISGSGYKTLNH